MPISYTCDHCGTIASSLDNWLIVSINLIRMIPNQPPPGGRTLDSTLPDLLFHEQACLDAWRSEKGV